MLIILDALVLFQALLNGTKIYLKCVCMIPGVDLGLTLASHASVPKNVGKRGVNFTYNKDLHLQDLRVLIFCWLPREIVS